MGQIVYIRCENYGEGKVRVGLDNKNIYVTYDKLIQLKNGDYAIRARRNWLTENCKGVIRVLINTKKGVIGKIIAIDDIVREGEAIIH